MENINEEYWTSLIIDFLTDKISEKEESLLFDWINESEDNLVFFNQFREIWISSGIGNSEIPFQQEKAFRLFKERIYAFKQIQQHKKRKLFIRVASIAVVMLPYILLLYLVGQYMEYESEWLRSSSLITSVIIPKGSQSQLELPDGTQVWLNSGSSIYYSNTFGQKDRELSLHGEAYFDVAKDETLPFIVCLEKLQIEALGTRFNVKAYEQLDHIKVSLLEGVISLQSIEGKRRYLLNPDEVAVYNKKLNNVAINKTHLPHDHGWINGEILFNGENFKEIAFMLEQHFNVVIDIKSESLKERKFKGDFSKRETIDRIFNVMATDGQFCYKIMDEHIEVY